MAETPDRLVFIARQHALGRAVFSARCKALLPILVVLWIAAGGFVMVEPSPYEFMFLLVLPVALFGGLGLYRGNINLLNLLIFFMPFALIAAFQPRHFEITVSLIYVFVTMFLWLTAYFVANYITQAPLDRMRLIIRTYTLVALAVALIGTLAYLGLLPGRDLFLKFGRAKATFQDPNVYGPFLVVPAMFALQRLFLLKGRQAGFAAAIFLVLFVGIFVSFSRGAWGHLGASSLILFALVYTLEAKAHDKVRMIILILIGVLALTALLAALLSLDPVRNLFAQRFSLAENYDTGSTGRFGRQGYALDLVIAHPWGIGPYEFTALRVVEDPHNTYVKVLLTYGWMGGFAYIVLIGMTLWRGLSRVFKRSSNRFLLMPLIAVYIPLIIESAIIDTDHWRHFYLVTGMIWGVTARYRSAETTPQARDSLII